MAHSRFRVSALLLCLLLFAANSAHAHFGMLIPSKSLVTASKDSTITLSLRFWHPFANSGMDMEKPLSFQVFHNGQKNDLLPTLSPAKEQGKAVWRGTYAVQKPGLHVFAMEPRPYFEEEEDCFIVHHTKVYVGAYGDDEGWDAPVGLKTEIVPLSRPGALYAGNLFQGQVLTNGKPVPGAEVEVEWYPGPGLQGVAPAESMITQSVKADAAGCFAFVAPRAGWWGFAALQDADYSIEHKGEKKHVELGAVFWVEFAEALAPVPLKKTAAQ